MVRVLPRSRSGRTALAALVLVLIILGTCGYSVLATESRPGSSDPEIAILPEEMVSLSEVALASAEGVPRTSSN